MVLVYPCLFNIWRGVRFSVVPPPECKRATARVLRLVYVCEREHRPITHGELQFDVQNASWPVRHEDLRIQRMAECFLESYLSKKA